MKTRLAASALLILATTSAAAQPAPFDMSGERQAEGIVDPKADQPLPREDRKDAGGALPSAADTDPAATFRRPLLPFETLELSGEFEQKSWSVYLTPEQAAAGAKLMLGYQNSIFVAPEASRLSIRLNGAVVGEEPISSSDGIRQLSFEVPGGLLRAGSNLVNIEASQRHRTDCSIESTYELWSAIDLQKTYLAFGDAAVATFSRADDIKAVGTSDRGLTRFRIVVPALEQPGTTASLMRLVQGLALIANMPNQSFSFDTVLTDAQAAAEMTVVVGTAAELAAILPAVPAEASSGPVARFVENPASGRPTLLVSGPTWQAVQAAIDGIVTPVDPVPGTRRNILLTERWRYPDAPLMFADTRLSFAQLGIITQEFSGRRFRTDFTIGVPGDFYAGAYGEAQILLDAAYSDGVLPGSHIDVYVNGNIASTVPITAAGGGIFRRLPIRVTMRHFKPGLNTIAIEAVMTAEEDKRCAPGATAAQTKRFALFDTSEFHMPDFARVGQVPNLSATFGVGFPYGFSTGTVPLFMDRLEAGTLSAAATLMGRMAQAAGKAMKVEVVASPLQVGDGDAIFVGAISQIPQTVLAQMKIEATTITRWGSLSPANRSGAETSEAIAAWRSRLSSGTWGGQITAFQDWLKRNFDISASSLRFAPAAERDFRPDDTATLLIAQSGSPSGEGTWTLVSAPSGAALWSGMLSLSTDTHWPQIEGSFATYAGTTRKIATTPVSNFRFVASQPVSLVNSRLIAANWLSTNILSYAFFLAVLSVALGLATAAMLTTLGRRR